MQIITQTNRTILFQEINPEIENLNILTGPVTEGRSLDDDMIKEINEKLSVRDFDEFLLKFSPGIYGCFDVYSQKMRFTLRKPNISQNKFTYIPINKNNDFLQMLTSLMDWDREDGPFYDFKMRDILDMLSPRYALESVKDLRDEIQQTFHRYFELDEKSEKKAALLDALQGLFRKAGERCYDLMTLLPIVIEDIKNSLFSDGVSDEFGSAFDQSLLHSQGELSILKVSQGKQRKCLQLSKSERAFLLEAFGESCTELKSMSPFFRRLVERTFFPFRNEIESRAEYQEAAELYNHYLEFYRKIKEEFMKASKPLVENILGVKSFFDQYGSDEKGMKPVLIITNVKPADQVEASNLNRLNAYLDAVNGKINYERTIWFGIVPDVQLNDEKAKKINRIRFPGVSEEREAAETTNNILASLLQTVSLYKIILFFSFQPYEHLTYEKAAEYGTAPYEEWCIPLTRKDFSEFAVPCLPNTTILSKEKSGIYIGRKVKMDADGKVNWSDEKRDIEKFWIGGIYIGAAYAAAGLVCAWQCPVFLSRHFKNTHPEYPGVRFDIESENNRYQLTARMAKEIWGYPKEIRERIQREAFGFVFSSGQGPANLKPINKITVYHARNLSETHHVWEPVYQVLTTVYIERMLRYNTSDFKLDSLKKFFSNHPDSPKSMWNARKEFVNSILIKEETLDYEINEKTKHCQIEIIFHDHTKTFSVDYD